MASALSRTKLARMAGRLNARARHPFPLPALILMTDELRLADPAAAAATLPPNTAIVLRHHHPAARAKLAAILVKIAQARGLVFLIAGDAGLAARVGADGLHLPEARLGEAAHWRALHPFWLITVGAHSERALLKAKHAGADAALLAPVFATESHPGGAPLGVPRVRLMAARARLPVYALGGVSASNIGRLAGAKLAGIAGIAALVPD